MNRGLLLVVLLAATLGCSGALAHELRPAYLDLLEVGPGEYAVLWKTPMRGDLQLSLTPEFSGEAEVISEVTGQARAGAAIQEWTLRAPALRGQTVRIRGLESTMTDAAVRITFADGRAWTHLLTPRAPAAQIPEMHEKLTPMTQVTQVLFPPVAAIAAWGLMCLASTVARTGRGGSRRWIFVSGAYAIGLTAGFVLVRAIVDFLPAA